MQIIRTLKVGLVWLICIAAPALSDPVDSIVHGSGEALFGDLSEIKQRRILRVLVTHSRTDFFVDEGRLLGVQAEIASELAKFLNRDARRESDKIFLQFVPVEFAELIPALIDGRGDIAAAYLTQTEERLQQIDFASGQQLRVKEVLVAHKDAPPIEKLADLSGHRVDVLQSSSYVAHLRKLNQQFELLEMPLVDIVEGDSRLLTEDLLELVNAGVMQYTISDDFKAVLWSEVLTDIRVHDQIAVSDENLVGWAIRKDSPELSAEMEAFSHKVQKGSFLGNIIFNKYFEGTRWISDPTSIEERKKLNQFIHLFEEYAGSYNHDPLALAAQAYQESGLDHSRVSHRGAVGIMQLLPSTAKDPNVGIPDIEVLENNIHAGAKYMAFLEERYFSDPAITPLDRKLFSWAAYNAGPANVRRLRNAAKAAGLDPNVWFGSVEVMAAQKISREPVRYVANIYKYYTAYTLIRDRELSREAAIKDLQ